MFENILYQDRLVSQLRQEVTQKTLPPSLLFWGPPLSAKLTAALELARALSCDQEASWNCTCDHCRSHRTLDYPYLLLLGPKNFLPEIEAGATLLLTHRTEARRYFLLRAVRKLLKRFDPVLWEGEEAKLKTSAGALGALQEDLEALYPPKELPANLEALVQKIMDQSRTLAQALPQGGVPIHQVRRLSTWARTTGTGHRKFIYIEAADRLQEGSRNALLKILEEPPVNTTFILLTSQKGAIIPTILSRLRSFAFTERTEDQEKVILEKLFHSQESHQGLKDYFQAFETEKKGLFDELAKNFFEGLSQPLFPLESYGKFWSAENNFRSFLEALAQHQRLHQDLTGLAREKQEKIYRLIQEALVRRETYNLSAPLLVETLFYQVRALK